MSSSSEGPSFFFARACSTPKYRTPANQEGVRARASRFLSSGVLFPAGMSLSFSSPFGVEFGSLSGGTVSGGMVPQKRFQRKNRSSSSLFPFPHRASRSSLESTASIARYFFGTSRQAS